MTGKEEMKEIEEINIEKAQNQDRNQHQHPNLAMVPNPSQGTNLDPDQDPNHHNHKDQNLDHEIDEMIITAENRRGVKSQHINHLHMHERWNVSKVDVQIANHGICVCMMTVQVDAQIVARNLTGVVVRRGYRKRSIFVNIAIGR